MLTGLGAPLELLNFPGSILPLTMLLMCSTIGISYRNQELLYFGLSQHQLNLIEALLVISVNDIDCSLMCFLQILNIFFSYDILFRLADDKLGVNLAGVLLTGLIVFVMGGSHGGNSWTAICGCMCFYLIPSSHNFFVYYARKFSIRIYENHHYNFWKTALEGLRLYTEKS